MQCAFQPGSTFNPVQLKSEHPLLFLVNDRPRPSHRNRDNYDFARAQYFGFCVSRRAASSSAETEITLEHLSLNVRVATKSCYIRLRDITCGRAMRRCNPLDRIYRLTQHAVGKIWGHIFVGRLPRNFQRSVRNLQISKGVLF